MGKDSGAAVAPFDHERAAAASRVLLIAVGEDPDREGLQTPPARGAPTEPKRSPRRREAAESPPVRGASIETTATAT